MQKNITDFLKPTESKTNDSEEKPKAKSLGQKSASVFAPLDSGPRPLKRSSDANGVPSESGHLRIETIKRVKVDEITANVNKNDLVEEPSTPPVTVEDIENNNNNTENKPIVKDFEVSKDVAIQATIQKKNQMSRAFSTPVYTTSSKQSEEPEKDVVPNSKKEEEDTDEEEFEEDSDNETISNNNNNNNNNKDRSRSNLKYEHTTESGCRLQVRHGDICYEDVDAIVNAANEYLAHGGGVAGAISRTGGSAVQKESNQWIKKYGEVATGDCAVTGPGKLICKCIIHAVGPVWRSGKDEPRLLKLSVLNSLKKADELKLNSISFPAISSGIFGFPKPLCAKIMFDSALEYLDENKKTSLKEIRFTNFDQPTVSVFSDEFKSRFKA